MAKYIVRRILQAIPLIILIAVTVFVLLKLSGDPLAYLAEDPRVTEADRLLLRARYGLDDPLPLQFVHWLIGDDWYWRDITGDGVPDEPGRRRGVLRGDFGESIRYGKPVTEVIGQFLPNTLILGVTAYAVIIVTSLAVGIFAALRQYTAADNIITAISFVLYSMPVFLLALLLVQLFAVQFQKWGLPSLPVSGMYDPRGDGSFDELLRHLILPVASLALISIAGYSRYIRATMLEVINSDYVRTARAKGLGERRINFVHALKNASLPLVTLIGIDLPFVLSGAVITETIFSWPGMGFMYINALEQLDAPLLVAFVLLIAIAVVFFQLLTDIIYGWLDPRIRYD
jgi:peptide/nickel transport system permease protein